MMASFKHLMLYAVCAFFIIPVNAQYQSSDFLPTQIISDGLMAPGRLAMDSNDNVYAVDAIQKNVVQYDAQGNFITAIDIGIRPLSIAVRSKNELYISDQITGDIYKYRNGSASLFYTGLSFPSSMVYDISNRILYVVDSEQKKVIGLNKFGTVVLDFTYNTFTRPTGIALDPVNNHLIVSEHGGIGEDVQECGGGCSICWGTDGPVTTIYIFDIEGNFISQFGCFGTSDGLFQRIQGITVDDSGNIFAADPYLGRVSIFDSFGNYITHFGQQGDALGEFNLPMDIAFSSDNRVFVTSMNKGTIDVFTIGPPLRPSAPVASTNEEGHINHSMKIDGLDSKGVSIYPNPSNGEFTVRIQTEAPITTDISIMIYSLSGQLIYSEGFDPKIEDPNNSTIYRNLKIGNISNGMYILRINAGSFVTQEKLILMD